MYKPFLILLFFFSYCRINAAPIELVTPHHKVTIVIDKAGSRLDSICAQLLAEDIQRVTGYLPAVIYDLNLAKGNVIIIGTAGSEILSRIKGPSDRSLKGTWERYALRILNNPTKTIQKALVGVFSISEKIGISPWYWWADVHPAVKKQLIIDVKYHTSPSPSVKYRGIFINDEDWGLQPWAAKTFERETGDIGPKTYAKVFELLLRLKANLIWPAMHPSTKPFYSYPGNKKMAADYDIVVGSSHAEPMLRNNVGEWDEKKMGHFNYVTNRQGVYNYWESRVKESSANNVIYTIGMRGVHDSGMEGVKDSKDAIPLLQNIFNDQRGLMQKYIQKDAAEIPQVFTIYKEVLDIYEAGLPVPDDVTLVWPDDNYGYIQRLNSKAEKERHGGSGVYYHASYWGRPHDYLWLSTTHPALIREEMTKAYQAEARNLWVVNAGDIKPGEYNLQLFTDMAYDITPFLKSEYSATHLQNWVAGIFGAGKAPAISGLLWKYYQLAFERKPEFMGWSQTEPTTQTKLTAYNHFYYGDQAQQRVDAYNDIETRAKTIGKTVHSYRRDAYYQLVQYPVTGASLMNKKFLYHDKAGLYAAQSRLSARSYQKLSEDAYKEIVKETDYYNNALAAGKWKYMMSFHPRDLPVYQRPKFDSIPSKTQAQWLVLPEGYKSNDGRRSFTLPKFDAWNRQRYFLDVYLSKAITTTLNISASDDWIKVSADQITLTGEGLKSQHRLWIEIDWTKAPRKVAGGQVIIKDASTQVAITVSANNSPIPLLHNFKGAISSDSYLTINAAGYSAVSNTASAEWKVISQLGSSGKSMETFTDSPAININDTLALRSSAALTYDFYTLKEADANFRIYTLPTHPLNKEYEMRYAVSIDNSPPQLFDIKTFGRSEEWKQNVLSNSAVRSISNKHLTAGKHRITFYLIDPGVILDRIFIDLGNAQDYYGGVSEHL